MRLFRRMPLAQVEVLTLRPDDRIVIETLERIAPKHLDEMRRQAAQAVGVDETRVIIVYNATLKVLRHGDPPPPPLIIAPGTHP